MADQGNWEQNERIARRRKTGAERSRKDRRMSTEASREERRAHAQGARAHANQTQPDLSRKRTRKAKSASRQSQSAAQHDAVREDDRLAHAEARASAPELTEAQTAAKQGLNREAQAKRRRSSPERTTALDSVRQRQRRLSAAATEVLDPPAEVLLPQPELHAATSEVGTATENTAGISSVNARRGDGDAADDEGTRHYVSRGASLGDRRSMAEGRICRQYDHGAFRAYACFDFFENVEKANVIHVVHMSCRAAFYIGRRGDGCGRGGAGSG